jgi:hypothetical protein
MASLLDVRLALDGIPVVMGGVEESTSALALPIAQHSTDSHSSDT